MFLSGVTVFLAGVMNLETSFLSCLVLGAYIRSTCIEVTYSAKNTYIKGADTKDTDTKDIYARGAYTGFISGAGTERTCTGGASIIKHSKIHLKSFSILEVELFDMLMLINRYTTIEI